MKVKIHKDTDKYRCPNCNSLAVTVVDGWCNAAAAIVLFGISLIIPVIGWVIAPFLFIFAIGMLIAAPFTKKLKCSCRTCNYDFYEMK